MPATFMMSAELPTNGTATAPARPGPTPLCRGRFKKGAFIVDGGQVGAELGAVAGTREIDQPRQRRIPRCPGAA